ncbi:MAG: glycosyltransferase family 2 protein [Rhodococcus sp. (in: high G+C Gram-positive bacteria)]|uniref:glycosyltransferase family 2 protein n=1 Tax=Rhodococcus sp. TaxID=1831 RepID=UPI002AD94128|nr:glycosyltransferase family 2 protein [Rhodococcus sp. (in: high G+C Gram-positive bacteria)]
MGDQVCPPKVASVDVVIPMYNCGNYLDECVNSVLTQTVEPTTIVLVDDCSTDNSFEAAECLALNSQVEIVVLRLESNVGAGAARNIGLTRCSSEFVWFVDADDRADCNFISAMTSAIGHADFGVCRTRRIDEDGALGEIDEPPFLNSSVSGVGYANMLLTGRARAYPPTKLFRRSSLGCAPWDERRCYEDFAPTLRMSLATHAVSLVNSPLYQYRRRPNSSSMVFSENTFGLLAMNDDVLSLLREKGLHTQWDRQVRDFTYREVLIPLAHMAMRAEHDNPESADARHLISRALKDVSDRVRLVDLIKLVIAGNPGSAIRGALLTATPGIYSRILRWR